MDGYEALRTPLTPQMVVDTIHLKSASTVYPTYRLLGHEFGECLATHGSQADPVAVIDLPVQTLILSAVGAAVLFRYALSLFRLLLEITVLPGTNVSSFIGQ
jgi:17beta-estradiol 17-dehydrogenase / very-long-chain 3-oxoacyl-CoA reductase